MIREISIDEFEIIDDIFERLLKSMDGMAPSDLKEQLRDAVSNDKAALFASIDSDDKPNGIASFGKVSSRISFVYADHDTDVGCHLVTAILSRFRNTSQYIGVSGPFVDERLQKHLLELGFQQFDRAHMTLPRAQVMDHRMKELPNGITLDVYTADQRRTIAEVIYRGNIENIDVMVFPNFFASLEATTRLLEEIEGSRYGEYKEPYSWVLKKDGSSIGACFMTIRNGDMGYIPDIVVLPEFQGQGLGKILLVHSMKELLRGESGVSKVNLDVTLSNKAHFLYESLGFTPVREYSIFLWAA